MEPQFSSFEKLNLKNYRNKLLIIDIDGVLAVEQLDIPLEERNAVNGAQNSIKLLQKKGYKIILLTSRFRSQKEATIEWLNKNNIPFDDIIFGKPRGILYIDDRGYRFRGWKKFFDDVEL